MTKAEAYLWAQEESERAAHLWGEGFSAAHIARELGGKITRSAVLGRLSRMGALGQPRAKRPAKAEPAGAAASTQSKLVDPPGQAQKGKRAREAQRDGFDPIAASPKATPKPEAPMPVTRAIAEPPAGGIGFWNIRDRQCHYVVAEGDLDGIRYCGREAVCLSYCDHHVGKIFVNGGEKILRRLQGSRP